MEKKIIKKAGKYFTEFEKHKIIQELISTKCTKVEIWEKYTGEEEEHGQLLRWMKQLGYNTAIKIIMPYLHKAFWKTVYHCSFIIVYSYIVLI